MRKLMINLVPEYDATDDIQNPTALKIYKFMKRGKIYTRKDIAKQLGIPSPTVTARVSDLIMNKAVVESADVWDEEAKRYIGGIQLT